MVEAALDRVRKVLALPGITPAGLAKRAKLHPNSLYSATSPEWNPSANTLRALEPVLKEIEAEHVVSHGAHDSCDAKPVSPDSFADPIGSADPSAAGLPGSEAAVAEGEGARFALPGGRAA
jgi:hypothetical protein